ncbi:MAG: hypothetical protein FWG64_10995 [Firmicutes bacterium]|nr:hypothetical protein [Bacillota bacterium]
MKNKLKIITFGFAKCLLTIFTFFVATILLSPDIVETGISYPRLFQHHLGFPFRAVSIFSDSQYVSNWSLFFDGNYGVSINLIQFLLNMFLAFVVVELLAAKIKKGKLKNVNTQIEDL